MSINYYIVYAKGGHVGRDNYYPMCLPIKAQSKKEAASIARDKPRVKRGHPDAILDVKECSYEEFVAQHIANSTNPYFLATSKHQQNECFDLIKPLLVHDSHHDTIQKTNKRESKKYYMSKNQCLIDDYESRLSDDEEEYLNEYFN